MLPLCIFDRNILDSLHAMIKESHLSTKAYSHSKKQLQEIGLDLALYCGDPLEIFAQLAVEFDEVLCSCDFDAYTTARDRAIEELLPMQRFYDSFLIHPTDALKADSTPYKVFTPFYNSLKPLWQSDAIEEYRYSSTAKLYGYDYSFVPTLQEMGFKPQRLPSFLYQNAEELLVEFLPKLESYQEYRDYFALDGTSRLSTHLRFGLISPSRFSTESKPIMRVSFLYESFSGESFTTPSSTASPLVNLRTLMAKK